MKTKAAIKEMFPYILPQQANAAISVSKGKTPV
jgi:hypothetical protein